MTKTDIRKDLFVDVVEVVAADVGILLELGSLHDSIIDNPHFQVVQPEVLSGLEQLQLLAELLRDHHVRLRAWRVKVVEEVDHLLQLVSVDVLQVDAVCVREALVLVALGRLSLLKHLHYPGDYLIFLDFGC